MSVLDLDVCASMCHIGIIMIVYFQVGTSRYVSQFRMTCCYAVGCHIQAEGDWSMLAYSVFPINKCNICFYSQSNRSGVCSLILQNIDFRRSSQVLYQQPFYPAGAFFPITTTNKGWNFQCSLFQDSLKQTNIPVFKVNTLKEGNYKRDS